MDRPVMRVALVDRTQLTSNTLELHFERPADIAFRAGQKVTLAQGAIGRDYSLISAPDAATLSFCVRLVPGGQFTPILARAAVGEAFQISPPFGFFMFQTTERTPVFIATGTGIAPFVSYARSGVRRFHLLHGVRHPHQLYYKSELQRCADLYMPCVSGGTSESAPSVHAGRVTDVLQHHLAPGQYDFYLCGRGDMIRDATRIIDRRFEGARIFTEMFY